MQVLNPVDRATEEPGPLGLVQGSSGAPEVHSYDSRNRFRKACLLDNTLNNSTREAGGYLVLDGTSSSGAALVSSIPTEVRVVPRPTGTKD